MTSQIIIHGVLLAIYDTGVLIIGASNIGKSELALSLIQRGHRLIADDAVLLQKEQNYILCACPPDTQGLLAIRDLGIINVIKLFGQESVSACKKLDLIIQLTHEHKKEITSTDTHLQGVIARQDLMGVSVPQQTLLVKPNRDLALLIETSVRLYQFRQTGYDADTDRMANSLLNSNHP